MWDTNHPRLEQPIQYPHMLFWTADGTIKKILLRQLTPDVPFWLTEKQLELLGPNAELNAWPGELDPDIEMPDDSDESDEEEEANTFGSGDVRELEGCVLTITNFDSRSGERSVGEEYMPGGNLVVSLQVSLPFSFLYLQLCRINRFPLSRSCVHHYQCGDPALSEAFVSVVLKNTEFEMFPANSGEKVGLFKPDYPLPWDLFAEQHDPNHNVEVSYRKPQRPIPEGVALSKDGQSILYHSSDEELLDENGEELKVCLPLVVAAGCFPT